MIRYILLYQPPCGDWYVHSHKLYPTHDDAHRAALKFLPAGTPIYVLEADVGSIAATLVAS